MKDPQKSKRVCYKLTHPILGSEPVYFDSWMDACDYSLEKSEAEAKRRLNVQLVNLMFNLSDEIMETAEEVDGPEADY